ncbi:MAG: glycosyltransferase family 39 protein [Planctomycetes bacterium]|nr:glycosyltransferase family 39 protein [Planctomycetota bacterium]
MNHPIPFTRLLGILLAVELALLLSVIGRSALSRIDEGQIAEVAREMAAGRDWITPRIGGNPFGPYPPLGYWLSAISGALFGFNEFAMRLPTALAALALLAVVAGMARRLAGPEAGLASAMILATLPAFFVQSGMCRADVLTLLFAAAAFDRFLAWADGGRRPRDLALMYVFTALGILAKGPLAVALLGLGGLSRFLLRREWKLLLAMKLWIGIPGVLLIVAPWYWAVTRINGWDFLRENLLLENLNAFAEGYQQKRPPYFYLKQGPLLLPWLLVLPLAWKVRRSPGVALSLAWFAMVAVFFTISSAKRINYLTYFAAPLALAAGTTLAALWAEAPRLARAGIIALALSLAAGAALVAAVPASSWTGGSVSRIAPHFGAIALAAGSAALVIAGTGWRGGARAGAAAAAAAILAGFFVYGFFINPRLNADNRETADFCRRAAARLPPGERLFVASPDGLGGIYHFYVGAAMPMKMGEPGFYLASDAQHQALLKEGRIVQVLDSLLDPRGRSQYLLRVIQ